jgi:hypothetical protein
MLGHWGVIGTSSTSVALVCCSWRTAPEQYADAAAEAVTYGSW